jgi:hypothetical protein
MSCSGNSDCLCGCCGGTSVQTPQLETNRPGLPAVSYRVGTWANFKKSMLARLSSSDYPALAGLKTRSNDDFTVAFLDATAIVLDILTFYQERLVNENYLRTATQLRSLTELARLISYTPAPGVSASVYLAFTLKTTPGLPPDPSAPAITIPQGTQVQSVPAQGQTSQTFETSADIQAKPDWNALPVLAGIPWQPKKKKKSIYLQGTSTQLQPGDSLLILGVDREQWQWQVNNGSPSEDWDVVVLNRVQVDSVHKLTYVTWDAPLSHESGPSSLSRTAAKVFAFRQKAALFGHNAPDPNLFANNNVSPQTPSLHNLIDASTNADKWQWKGYINSVSASQIYLDAPYQKIVVGSWFVLVSAASTPLIAELYKVQGAATESVSEFALAGKATVLAADFPDPKISTTFQLQSTEVWAQSEQLTVAQQPIPYPLYGSILDLQDVRSDLTSVQVLAVSGKRQKLAVGDGITNLQFICKSNGAQLPLNPGDILILTDTKSLPLNPNSPVPDWNSPLNGSITLDVEDSSGRKGTVMITIPKVLTDIKISGEVGVRRFAKFNIEIEKRSNSAKRSNSLSDYFDLAPSNDKDPEVSEIVFVTQVTTDTTANGAQPPTVEAPNYPRTRFQLKDPLSNCYDRSTATVNANAGLATHGQSVSEILGSGSASTRNQSFTLKQFPLTYVQNPSAQTGRQSTLQVQVNSVTWKEMPTLYNQGSAAQVFTTLNGADTKTEVIFGDGVEGALLPTGQNNLRANYRIGSGSQGNVAAGKLTTLMDRPLGVSGVTNPEDACSGQDADSPDDIRTNAPQTVLTLGRAVSITDYQEIASTYAGIAKGYAIWISMGPGLGLYLTLAGPDGKAVSNDTMTSLVSHLQKFGNPLIPITPVPCTLTQFTFSAQLQYDSDYDQTAVEAQVLEAVQTAFSFDARSFGQSVSVDEIAAVIQNVSGVVAVNVTLLTNESTMVSQPRLCAALPIASADSTPNPAEILVLDPNFSAATAFTTMP